MREGTRSTILGRTLDSTIIGIHGFRLFIQENQEDGLLGIIATAVDELLTTSGNVLTALTFSNLNCDISGDEKLNPL